MNDTQIARIAAAVNALRPDWPAASVATIIRSKLATRAPRDVAIALTWVACDPDSSTPARVLEQGPWWRAAVVEADPRLQHRRPPRTEEQCPRHVGEYAGPACRCCASERLAPQDELGGQVPQRSRDEWVAEARRIFRPHVLDEDAAEEVAP